MVEKKAHKRLNYFTGQLLTEEDFRDEQQYHVDALRSHNEYLHTWGIARGLEVEKRGRKNVSVSLGMAIDGLGRQIVLDQLEELDLSQTTEPALYLTISYKDSETDLKESEGEKHSTRITEEHVIEFEKEKPSDASMKIVLAKLKFDLEKNLLESIDLKDRKQVKYIGGDIEARSIAFSITQADPEQFPNVKGINGSNPGLEIVSENTILRGNLNVSGTLTGTLGTAMVRTDQIEDKSVTISKLATKFSGGTDEIGPKSEKEVDITEPSTKHRFFITSVVPIDPDSAIEWKWQVVRGNINLLRHPKLKERITGWFSKKAQTEKAPSQESTKKPDTKVVSPTDQKEQQHEKIRKILKKENDKFSYVLVVKNLTAKKIEVEYTSYEILE